MSAARIVDHFYLILISSGGVGEVKIGKQILYLLIILPACSMAQTVRPMGDGNWYYSIGGGDPMMYYHQSNKTTLDLEVGAEWNLFRRCSFDPSFSISDTFSNIEENLYGMANDVLDSALVTFSAWGLSKIQENHPGLYDQIAKGLSDAKESYQLSLKNCRDVQADLRANRNPIDGWYSVTRKSSWAQASAEGENPVTAEAEIEENSGERGLTWVGGDLAGGRNLDNTLQPPIRAVGDVVWAGYDHLVGDDVIDLDDADGMPEVTGDPNIARVFPDPEDAAEWTVAVVGEREIRLCDGCEKLNTTVGQGLRFQYKEERRLVDPQLQAVVADLDFDEEDLDALSVNSMGITVNEHLIRSLQQAPIQERLLTMNRLAGEIALARVMEKALMARDLLNAGSLEPNVTAVGDVATSEVEYARARLQQEIDNILYEARVRKEVINNAAGVISERGANREASPEALDLMGGQRANRQFRDGGIVDE